MMFDFPENIPVLITIDSAVDEPTAKLASNFLNFLLKYKKLSGAVVLVLLGIKDGHSELEKASHEIISDFSPLADEFLQMAKDMDWQPIESAPKDGSFLVMNEEEEYSISEPHDRHWEWTAFEATHWRPIKSLDDYPLVKAFVEGV